MFDHSRLYQEVKNSELLEPCEEVFEYPFCWEAFKKKNSDDRLYIITLESWSHLAIEIKIIRNGEIWYRTDFLEYIEYRTVKKGGNVSVKKIYRTELASNIISRAWKSHRERKKHRLIREQFTEWAFRPWNAGGQFIINKLKCIKT